MFQELIREANAFSPQGVCGLANSSGGGEAKITQTREAAEQNTQRTQRLLVSRKTQKCGRGSALERGPESWTGFLGRGRWPESRRQMARVQAQAPSPAPPATGVMPGTL